MAFGPISVRGKRLMIAIGAALQVATPLLGQTITAPTPPVHSSVDPNGVDLLTGYVTPSEADLSIGDPANGGLVHTRTFSYQLEDGEYPIGGAVMATGWRHGFLITTSQNGAYTWFAISGGAHSAYFTRPDGAPYPSQDASGMGATLTPSGTTMKYTARDGTVINFDNSLLNDHPSYTAPTTYLPTSIVKPDGEIITFTYKKGSYQKNVYGNIVTYYVIRLQAVSNNYGYMLKYSYKANDPNSPDDWLTINAVAAVNLAQSYCDPTADSCSGVWPAVSYSDASLTDAAGNTYSAYVVTLPSGRKRVYRHEGIYARSQVISAIKDPSSSAFSVAYTFCDARHNPSCASFNVLTATRDGVLYTYNYNVTSEEQSDYSIHYKAEVDVDVGATPRWSAGSDETAGWINSLSIGGSTYRYYYYHNYIQTYVENGVLTSYNYDDRGNIISAGGGNRSIRAYYDTTCVNPKTCNKPNSIVDYLGQTTSLTYDPTHGGVLTVTAPAAVTGGVQPQARTAYAQLYAYYKDATGAIVAAPNGIYKPVGTSACISTASCAGTAGEMKTTIVYGAMGVANNLLPTITTTAAGDGSISSTTTLAYDAIGNKISEDGPLSGNADTSTWTYNADRQVTQSVGPDPDGAGPLHNRSVMTTYNDLGQVASVATGTSNPDGSGFTELNRTDTSYDSYHRRVGQTVTAGGAMQSRTDFGYDPLDRLACTAVRMNPAVYATLSVDGCTLGTAGIYGPDRITHSVFDDTDRLVKTQSAYGTPLQRDEVTYTYDTTFINLPSSVADAKGNLTSYGYDQWLGRLLKTSYPSKTTPGQVSATDNEQLTYDAAGHVTTRQLRDGKQITYTYDNLGRQTLAHMVNPVDGNDRDIATTYDLLGRVTSVDDGNGKKVSFTYDQLGRKLSESPQLTGGSTSYQYDAAGRRTQLTWSDGFYVNYDYDTLGELTAIRENGATSGVGVLASFAYDDEGKPVSLTRGNGINSSYAYDAASRLQSYTISHPTAGNTYSFAYNPAGQMVSRGMTNDAYAFTQAAIVNRNYTTNGLNQYTASGLVVPSYDGRGNTTSAGPTTYTYDSKNQLTNFGTNSLSYDAEGRLAAQAVPGTTHFVYDGSDLIAETDASNNILRRYVHIPGTDNVLVWYEGAGTTDRRWLAHDERGSTTLVADASGNSLGINAYDEYGIPASTNIGRFQYTGQTYLPELGMYYYKARMYSATLGRFMQTDPTGYDDGPNWYNYVKGDPVNGKDPTGNNTCYQNLPNSVYQGMSWGWQYVGTDPYASSTYSYECANDGVQGLYASYLVYVASRYAYGPYGPLFGNNPRLGKPNRFFPSGRVNTDRPGGAAQAEQDRDELARLNKITPLGPLILKLKTAAGILLSQALGSSYNLGDGWLMKANANSGYTIFTNLPSGFTYRFDGNGNTRIDIPVGFRLPSGGVTTTFETIHY